MAPGATERSVTITWIAGQVEHASQMINVRNCRCLIRNRIVKFNHPSHSCFGELQMQISRPCNFRIFYAHNARSKHILRDSNFVGQTIKLLESTNDPFFMHISIFAGLLLHVFITFWTAMVGVLSSAFWLGDPTISRVRN